MELVLWLGLRVFGSRAYRAYYIGFVRLRGGGFKSSGFFVNTSLETNIYGNLQ